MSELEKDDDVTWKTHGTETSGTVEQEITTETETEAAGHKANALEKD